MKHVQTKYLLFTYHVHRANTAAEYSVAYLADCIHVHWMRKNGINVTAGFINNVSRILIQMVAIFLGGVGVWVADIEVR